MAFMGRQGKMCRKIAEASSPCAMRPYPEFYLAFSSKKVYHSKKKIFYKVELVQNSHMFDVIGGESIKMRR